MTKEHEHYCADHDHRWRCAVDPCVQPAAQPCLTCRCGLTMRQVSTDPRVFACWEMRGYPYPSVGVRGFHNDGHDSLTIETTRRA
jgi:hypothetical protein